jgi:hypothetical protein
MVSNRLLSPSVSFLEIGRSHRVPNRGSTVGGGITPILCFARNCQVITKCGTVPCHGEAARSVLAKVRGDVFARFHTVAAKHRSRTQNSQFGLLGPVLRATTTAVYMAAPVRNILDTTSYINECAMCRRGAHAHYVTRHNTPVHSILSTAPQLSISQKALGTLPEDGNVMPKHVGDTIFN